MRNRYWVLLPLALAALALLAGCGSDSSDQSSGSDYGPDRTSEPPAETQPATVEMAMASERTRRPRGPLVKLRDSQFGPVLFDGQDRALYLFTRDGRNRSRCFGACAAAWPPFFAKGKPRAGKGVDSKLLSTIRRGKRRQVTYKGQPLYFYVGDPKGQVLCNDVVEFGGTWYALTAAGDPPA